MTSGCARPGTEVRVDFERVGFSFLDRPSLRGQFNVLPLLERSGYHALWLAESRLVREAPSLLGRFAGLTECLQLGILTNSWTRGPVLMALTLATLDEIAPGRIEAAFGTYWPELAEKQGIRRRDPIDQLREYIAIVRALLARKDEVTFRGRTIQVHDVWLDLIDGDDRSPIGVPIFVQATEIESAHLAGEVGDGMMVNGMMPPTVARAMLAAAAETATEHGRPWKGIECPQMVSVAMHVDAGVAINAAKRKLALYIGQQPHIAAASGISRDRLAQIRATLGGWPARSEAVAEAAMLVDEETVRRLMVVGDPDDCLAQMDQWRQSGISYPVVVPVTDNVSEICEAFSPR